MNIPAAQEWALRYVALGWRVFPVVPGAKRPMYKGWQRDATSDPSLIERYWHKEPAPNIGIVCGEAFVAFDIEAVHLPAFDAWLAHEGRRLPDTPVARTGRGGIHVLARARDPLRGRTLDLGGVHIGELKAGGGFIVACPSRTDGPYAWLRSPEEVNVADAPGWLLGLIRRSRTTGPMPRPSGLVGPTQGERRLGALARTVKAAREGERNGLLYWAMCRALEDGIPAPIASSVLTRMATDAGLGDREIEATIASAQAAGVQ